MFNGGDFEQYFCDGIIARRTTRGDFQPMFIRELLEAEDEERGEYRVRLTTLSGSGASREITLNVFDPGEDIKMMPDRFGYIQCDKNAVFTKWVVRHRHKKLMTHNSLGARTAGTGEGVGSINKVFKAVFNPKYHSLGAAVDQVAKGKLYSAAISSEVCIHLSPHFSIPVVQYCGRDVGLVNPKGYKLVLPESLTFMEEIIYDSAA